MDIDERVLQSAIRNLVGELDYDLMKAIDDPEDEFSRNWNDITVLFLHFIDKINSKENHDG